MTSSIRRLGALTFALVFASCSSDHATAPQQLPAAAGTPAASLTGDLSGVLRLTKHKTIKRTRPLRGPITVSEAIGPEGGVLRIREAGVTVVVPRGALRRTTVIVMTARAGRHIAYDFSPHGIVFDKPLIFRQSLRGTNVGVSELPALNLSYYRDASMIGETTAIVSELIDGVLTAVDWSFSAPIKHFSGYILTCGREESAE